MICINCNHELTECTCPDLGERIAEIQKCPHCYIHPAVLAKLKAQAERNQKKADDEQQSLTA